MNVRNLFFIVVAAVIAVLCVGAGYYFIGRQEGEKQQGKLVFSRTFNQGNRVDKIVITTAEGVTELVQKDSYWLVANRGGYYADFRLMHQFLTAVNQSVYSVKLPYSEKTARENYLLSPFEDKEDSGLLIQTYAGGEKLDEIIVGLPEESGRYFFARNLNSEKIWLIDGNFDLPIEAKYWLLRPVVSVSSAAVETITAGTASVSRETDAADFSDRQGRKINIWPLLNVLSGINIINALPEKEFMASDLQNNQKKMLEVITFYGLKFGFGLYYNGEGNVWLNVNLLTTPLPMAAVNDYIKDNDFLYDKWFFEVSPDQAHILRDFRLM